MPPAQLGHASRSWPRAEKITSGFSVTSPVAPSMWVITFWATVGLAHRNSPGSRSRVSTTGLAGDAGHHPPLLARLLAGVDPGAGVGVGGDRGVDEQALEGMVEVPVVVQVLVISSGSRRVGVEGERRVVVQVCVLDAAPQELRGWRGDGRADEDEIQVDPVTTTAPGRGRRSRVGGIVGVPGAF